MAEITCILAANIHREFFFVITTTANTRCLVQNFQLAVSKCHSSGSLRCSKLPNDRMVSVVKHWCLLVQGRVE